MKKGYMADWGDEPFPTEGHSQIKNLGKVNSWKARLRHFDESRPGKLTRLAAMIAVVGFGTYAAINLFLGRPWF